MIPHAIPMACGNCGHGQFRMFRMPTSAAPLVAECVKCSSTTIIRVAQPALELAWGPQAEGILTPMAPTS